LLAAPEGIARLITEYPKITIVTTAIDEYLNEHKYICPGLGNLSQRYFGV
jgi:uracil phosphoribosyltransferase